ncbi:MAG: hypothetical protein JW940_23825 [Polyangiaceae bacterium]|nr:hypothetical protein [Polyangiaceae bacterium]
MKSVTNDRHGRGLLCLAIVGLGLFTLSLAWAQNAPANKQAADALFQEAQSLMKKGQFDSACPKLAESQRLDPAVGTLMYLGFCYEQLGKLASAWSTYKAASAAAQQAGQADRARVARERVAQLEPKLPRLTVRVPEAVRVAGLKVECDGVVLETETWDQPQPWDPGTVKIQASAPGHETYATSTRVGPEPMTTVVEIPPLGERAAAAAPVAAPASTESSGQLITPPPSDAQSGRGTWATLRRYQRPAGIVLGALGVLSLGASSYFALSSASKEDQTSEHCGSRIGGPDADACDAKGMALNEQALDAAGAATWTAVLGGVAVAGGAVLYFTAPASKQTAVGRFEVVAGVGSNATRLSLRGAF